MDDARRRLSEDEFQQLLGRSREGDEDAFAALWRSFNPPLIRFLRGMADPEDAADLGSSVWLDVVRGLGRFAGSEAGFRAWLFTMARHRVIDLGRARGRRPRLVADADEPEDGDPGPAAVAERDWSTARAVALIGSLPPEQAEVVLLRVVADLDVATVAEIVGKRPGAVRVLAHRGLRRLAEHLTHHPLLDNR